MTVQTDSQQTALERGCGLHFVIPGKPVGKGRPRIGRRGAFTSLYTPQETLHYEGMVKFAALEALHGRPKFEGAVGVRMFIACEVPGSWSLRKTRQALEGSIYPTTKPDTDNVVKAVFDGCNGVAWRDDVQAVDLTLRKRYSATPFVEVWIDALEPQGRLL